MPLVVLNDSAAMGDDTKSRYVYKPLDTEPFEIRLLKILPADDAGSPLRLTLNTFVLDQLPGYAALSYTWGRPAESFPETWDDPTHTFDIEVNGQLLAIRPNLWHALRELRTKRRVPVWIDAICIDQENNAEKSHQVRHMARIYKSAIVFIWLGPADASTQLAFAQMNALAESWRRRPQALQQPVCKDPNLYDECQRFAAKEVPNLLTSWRAIERMLTRSWFRRAWIVQEACFARGSMFFSNNVELSWPDIWDVYQLVMQHALVSGRSESLRSKHDAVVLKALQRAFSRVAAIRSMFQIAGDHDSRSHPTDLSFVLGHLRGTTATDDRDKVYAGLSLSADGHLVDVDYEKPVAQVFASVVFALAATKYGKNVFGHCQLGSRIPDLPSWVPDWTQPAIRLPLPKSGCGLFKAHQEQVYNAGGTWLDSRTSRREQYTNVLVRGALLDEVVCVASLPPPPSLNDDAQALDAVFSLFQSNMGRNPSDDNVTWWAAPHCLQAWAHHHAEAHHRSAWIDSRAWHSPADPGPDAFTKPLYKPTDENLLQACMRTLAVDVCASTGREGREGRIGHATFKEFGRDTGPMRLRGRTMAWTRVGAMLLVPSETEVGDVLALFRGHEVPYILRKAEGGYLLVGECYAHGLMDGECALLAEATASWRNIPLV